MLGFTEPEKSLLAYMQKHGTSLSFSWKSGTGWEATWAIGTDAYLGFGDDLELALRDAYYNARSNNPKVGE